MIGSNQPNVTKVMNKLEQQLGCTLFIRSNKGVSLTAEGQMLYDRVKIAFEQIRQAECELERDTSYESGVVSIGASSSAIHGALLDILCEYHVNHPNVRIRLSNYSTPQALQALKQGVVDFCVITSPADIPKGLTMTKIRRFSEILIAGEDYEVDDTSDMTIEKLSEMPIISLAEETATYEYYTKLFAEHDRQFNPDIQAGTSAQLILLIKNNLGIGFVPEFMAAASEKEGKIKRLKLADRLPYRYICLVEDQDKGISAAASTLKRQIKERNYNPQ